MNGFAKRLLKAVIASSAIIVLFFALLPDAKIKDVPNKQKETFAKLADGQGDKQDDIAIADLNDYAPMFVRTKWNYSGVKSGLPKTALWNMQDNVSATTTPENISITLFSNKTSPNDNLQRTITMRSAFANFGKHDKTLSTTIEQKSTLIAKNTSNGKKIFELKIPQGSSPNAINIAEFHIRIFNSIAQAPILEKSSGNEENDNRIRNIIKKELHNLPDGEFKIIVIP